MKTGRIFWGFFFITVGILVLLENMCVLRVDWGYTWRWWPVLLILAGAAALLRIKIVKAVLVVVTAIALGFLVVSALNFSWMSGCSQGGPVVSADTLTVPFDTSVQRAKFVLDSGAGTFSIEDTCSDLVRAVARTNVGTYALQRSLDGEQDQIALDLQMPGRPRFWMNMKNRVDVRLNPAPAWDLAMDIGAAKVELDLTPFTVQNLDLDCGAASIVATLGERASETHISINAGASSLKIRVPEAVGCEVRLQGPLSSKKLSGFEKVDKNYYRTENFSDAAKRMYIDLDVGVSSVRVVRY
jgi:hypothetical protein